MKFPGYRNGSAGGVSCAPSARSAEESESGTGFSSHDSERGVMATATQSAHSKELESKQRSSTSRDFEDAQDEAVETLVELYQVFCAGLRSAGRPVGNLLFLGPTGSGKTRIDHDPHIAKAELYRGDGIEPQSGGRGNARNSRA